MNSKLKSVVVGAVFLVGCAVGGASSRLALPSANAQQANAQQPVSAPPNVPRWEYLCVASAPQAEEMNGHANLLGAQYWELTAIAGLPHDFPVLCFKRPKLGA